MTLTHFQGQLATSQHPLRYVAAIGAALFPMLGAWMMLLIVNRFRS